MRSLPSTRSLNNRILLFMVLQNRSTERPSLIRKPELLLPAGDLDKMKYALAFGADAVYLGIPRFSLRARENGFKDLSDVSKAVDYAHALGKKAYVTANIFAHNLKVRSFVNYTKDVLSICKPDAWIISDPGLFMLMRSHFPSEIVHISVQSNVMNYASASFWQKAGARRIILSREITIKEMQEIHDANPDLELESFVHGSMCMAYSGRCLISNYLAHRDSNQGLCTNSCRWQYKVLPQDPNTLSIKTAYGHDYTPLTQEFYLQESLREKDLLPIDEDENGTYLMNAKDLCAIRYLNELTQAGISAFKIEGRSKTLYYVSMIARAYRRAIDDWWAGKPFNEEHMQEILSTSTRGFNEGFLLGDPAHNAQEYEKSTSECGTFRFSGIVRGYDINEKRLKIEVRNPIRTGCTYELSTPETNIPLTIKEIYTEKNVAVHVIHGGLHSCQIPYPQDPGAFALLRERT